jgi:hypothetical protein
MLNLIEKAKQRKIKIAKKNSPSQIVEHLADSGGDTSAGCFELLLKLHVSWRESEYKGSSPTLVVGRTPSSLWPKMLDRSEFYRPPSISAPSSSAMADLQHHHPLRLHFAKNKKRARHGSLLKKSKRRRCRSYGSIPDMSGMEGQWRLRGVSGGIA